MSFVPCIPPTEGKYELFCNSSEVICKYIFWMEPCFGLAGLGLQKRARTGLKKMLYNRKQAIIFLSLRPGLPELTQNRIVGVLVLSWEGPLPQRCPIPFQALLKSACTLPWRETFKFYRMKVIQGNNLEERSTLCDSLKFQCVLSTCCVHHFLHSLLIRIRYF